MNENQSYSELQFSRTVWPQGVLAEHMLWSLQHSLWSTKHNNLLASAISIQNLKTCCSNDTSNKIFNCMASPVEVGRGRNSMNRNLALRLCPALTVAPHFTQVLLDAEHKSYISKSTNLMFQKAQIPHRKKHKSCITFRTNLNPPQGQIFWKCNQFRRTAFIPLLRSPIY